MDPAYDDDDTGALAPIPEDHVEVRVDLDLHWPAELEGDDSATAWGARQALEASRDMLASYRAGRRLHYADPNLTPRGAVESDARWVRENLPKLDKHASSVRQTIESIDRSMADLLGELAVRPEDEIEYLELKEIREWLARLPEHQRTEKLETLVARGDTKALRAVLSAPAAFLMGIDDDVLASLRAEVARKANPEKFARLQATRKAAVAAERAVDGVRRFLTHDSTLDGARLRPAELQPLGGWDHPTSVPAAPRTGPILRAPDHRRSQIEP